MRDLPNVIFYSSEYKSLMQARKEPRGKYVNPNFAEQLMGFPRNWTSIDPNEQVVKNENLGHSTKMKTASLFSGVAGLELGLQAAMEAAFFCDKDEAVQCVLRRRMADGNLPDVPIYGDIATIPDEVFADVEALAAGFPCPDIAISGQRRGLAGERSGLFFYIIKKLAKAPSLKVIVLENVGHIISKFDRTSAWCR